MEFWYKQMFWNGTQSFHSNCLPNGPGETCFSQLVMQNDLLPLELNEKNYKNWGKTFTVSKGPTSAITNVTKHLYQ